MSERESLKEFDIIARYFSDIVPAASANTSVTVELGVGDDCAVLNLPDGHRLALSIDTLVAGRHFPADANAFDIAQRAVAVAVSDLAAMGATPLAFTLAICLPEVDSRWLQAFSHGLRKAAQVYSLPLIGGDTTKGPLTITVQVHGTLAVGCGLKRSGASSGDRIFVSGTLGDGAAALAVVDPSVQFGTTPLSTEHLTEKQRAYFHQQFYAPTAQINLGQSLLSVASAAIDISDGLLADLGHICKASGLGALIQMDKLPLSQELLALATAQLPGNNADDALDCALGYALCGGDDYELCFTVAEQQCQTMIEVAAQLGVAITEIGEMVVGDAVVCLDKNGKPMYFSHRGYQHF